MSITSGFALEGAGGTTAVYLDGTAGTLRMGDIPGSLAVYFDQTPSVNASFSGTVGVNLGKVDGTLQVDVGKINDNVSVKFAGVPGTAGVNIGKIDGTIQTNIGKIDDVVAIKSSSSIAVHILSTGGTLRIGDIPGTVAVYFSPANPSVNASFSGTVGVNLGKQDGTLNVNVGKISDTIAVFLTGTAGTLGVNIGKISDTIAIWHTGTSGTLIVGLDRDKATLSGILSSIGVNIGKVDGTINVNVGKIADTIAVFLTGTSGSLNVKLDPGYNVVNGSQTIIIPQFVAGQVTGISLSGNTVLAPLASRVRKIYGYNLSTTARLSNITANFTNGAGTTPTKFTEDAMNDIAGMIVSPPAYLFATAAGSTLSLLISNAAGPVHYTVYYFNETA